MKSPITIRKTIPSIGALGILKKLLKKRKTKTTQALINPTAVEASALFSASAVAVAIAFDQITIRNVVLKTIGIKRVTLEAAPKSGRKRMAKEQAIAPARESHRVGTK